MTVARTLADAADLLDHDAASIDAACAALRRVIDECDTWEHAADRMDVWMWGYQQTVREMQADTIRGLVACIRAAIGDYLR